tara:strand:- start:707 stop:904 length:198 start_codon:yes stop_codon:yes gene_type:complete
MKVGDLVKWEGVSNDRSEQIETDYGIVLQLSRTGHDTRSAKILFQDGKVEWMKTTSMEVISEDRR